MLKAKRRNTKKELECDTIATRIARYKKVSLPAAERLRVRNKDEIPKHVDKVEQQKSGTAQTQVDTEKNYMAHNSIGGQILVKNVTFPNFIGS